MDSKLLCLPCYAPRFLMETQISGLKFTCELFYSAICVQNENVTENSIVVKGGYHACAFTVRPVPILGEHGK